MCVSVACGWGMYALFYLYDSLGLFFRRCVWSHAITRDTQPINLKLFNLTKNEIRRMHRATHVYVVCCICAAGRYRHGFI